MKKIVSSVVFIALAFTASAQKPNPAAYANLINGEQLKQHLTIIAGDAMEGRETGTQGQRLAAAYIEEQFKKIGLQPPPNQEGYQQYYPLFQDSAIITSSELSWNNETLLYGNDYYVQVTGNKTQTVEAGQLVFAGYGISHDAYDDYKGLDVKGKIVVLFSGEPKQDGKYIVSGTNRGSRFSYPGIAVKLKIAADNGAVAAIVVNQNIPAVTEAITASASKSKLYFPGAKDAGINYCFLSHAAFAKLFPAWKTDSLVQLAKQYQPMQAAAVPVQEAGIHFRYSKERKEVKASNVIGVIEGTDKKDEYVFLTAHYDHLGKKDGKIYYGADDDGSGTCAVINMAAAFAKAKAAGHGPRRTMVFMTVSGEEKGLWGSEYYSDHPLFPLDKTTVDLNTDMVGRTDTERQSDDTLNYVYVIGHDKLSSELQPINEGVNKKYTGLTLDYKFDDPKDKERIYYRSDHYNFARKGVPVLFFYDGMLKADYHRPTDTVDKINWELYQKRVRMIFHTAWEMANRDNMLIRDIPLKEE